MPTFDADPLASSPPRLRQTLTVWDVVTMNVVAVVTLRWITRAARMGPASLVLWALAWLVFFVPLASAVRELSSRYPEQGGIYAWTRRAFGPTHGFICGWCLWVNNLFYFPSMLLFAGANALLIFGGRYAALADSHLYSVAFVLAMLWASAALGVAGFRAGRWLNTIGALAIWVPAGLLIVCGSIAAATSGSATSFAPADFVPRGEFWGTLSLWSGVCFAFSGFEVSALVGQEVKAARRTIPRGVLLGGLLATIIYTAGTAAVLVAIPSAALSERTGLADVVSQVAGRAGLGGLSAVAGGLLALGMIAGSAAWFASAGRVPFAVGEDGGFPRAFTRLHARFRTPHLALLAQGIAASGLFLVSVFLTVAGARTTVQEAYDILVNLTILVYFVPYLYLFLSLVKLRTQRTDAPEETHVAGGRRGLLLAAGAGIAATVISLVLVFVPPAGTGNVVNYEVNVIGQTAALVACGLAVLWWARRERRP
jgi:amino acid transporter